MLKKKVSLTRQPTSRMPAWVFALGAAQSITPAQGKEGREHDSVRVEARFQTGLASYPQVPALRASSGSLFSPSSQGVDGFVLRDQPAVRTGVPIGVEVGVAKAIEPRWEVSAMLRGLHVASLTGPWSTAAPRFAQLSVPVSLSLNSRVSQASSWVWGVFTGVEARRNLYLNPTLDYQLDAALGRAGVRGSYDADFEWEVSAATALWSGFGLEVASSGESEAFTSSSERLVDLQMRLKLRLEQGRWLGVSAFHEQAQVQLQDSSEFEQQFGLQAVQPPSGGREVVYDLNGARLMISFEKRF